MICFQIKLRRTRKYYFVGGERVHVPLDKQWEAASEKAGAWLNDESSEEGIERKGNDENVAEKRKRRQKTSSRHGSNR